MGLTGKIPSHYLFRVWTDKQTDICYKSKVGFCMEFFLKYVFWEQNSLLAYERDFQPEK